MQICYFGIYSRTHPRNTTFISALRRAGHLVEELHEDSRPGVGKYLRLFRRLRKGRATFDAVIVGFPSQQATLVARLAYRGPIVSNMLLSLYDAVVRDRREIWALHPRALYLWLLDLAGAHASDIAIFDCDAYRQYVVDHMHIRPERTARIYQSANEEMLPPTEIPEESLIIHYYCSFIPSHGTDTIVRAAALLSDEGIHIILSGDGSCRARDEVLARELNAPVTFIPRLKGLEELNRFVRSSWVSLGAFAASGRGDRVIGTKVMEALWCARPVVLSDGAGARELLTDGKNALLVPHDDPEALATALRRLKDDDGLRRRLAGAGHATYLAHCALASLATQLEQIVNRARRTH